MDNGNIKSQYKEYGWSKSTKTLAHSFIYPELKAVIKFCDGKILDMGCGNGAIANALINEGYDVYGVDASDKGIEIANSVNKGHFLCWILQWAISRQIYKGKILRCYFNRSY